jgi:hypothetical protein
VTKKIKHFISSAPGAEHSGDPAFEHSVLSENSGGAFLSTVPSRRQILSVSVSAEVSEAGRAKSGGSLGSNRRRLTDFRRLFSSGDEPPTTAWVSATGSTPVGLSECLPPWR